MKPATRRHRHSDEPIGPQHAIAPADLHERYIRALGFLEPYHYCKYATIPWLHYLADPRIEYSVFRKYFAYLREAPNRYVGCPEQQKASPNTNYKHLVYDLRVRGLNELIRRGLVSKRRSSDPAAKVSARNHAFALHRSNSYYHEVIVDLGYHLPLRHLVASDPALRLIDFAQLLQHPKVPEVTRNAIDPLLIKLRDGEMRFDGTPHVVGRTEPDGIEYFLCVPGIQVDRGTERFSQVRKHIQNAIEFVEDRHYQRHWGFDSCVIPFLFTEPGRMLRALETLYLERQKCTYLLFQTIPDLGLEPHFPKPAHYDRNYRYQENEWVPAANTHIFTNPWQRVDCPDFYLNFLGEKGVT